MQNEDPIEIGYSEKPKENIEERFSRERSEWLTRMDNLTAKTRDIYTCSEALVDALSERQKALEYTHTLMSLVSKINATLREKKKERIMYYNMEHDYKLDKGHKEMFTEVDLKKDVMLQECLSNHLSYMRGTIDTYDKLLYGIKYRIQLEEFRRSQH